MVTTLRKSIAVIGAGPAGLMAAERLAASGHAVTVYDQMPSPGRKFLMAGRGGLNLTHSEPLEAFLARYGEGADRIRPAVRGFKPADLIAWAEGLGQATFTGSSGRVFPKAMKASPLLRAWLLRLNRAGVRLEMRHRWVGWRADGALAFARADGSEIVVRADATLLALGGASWPRLGSDGAWQSVLEAAGVAVAPLVASNAGVVIRWSEHIVPRFEGAPLKRIAVACGATRVRGEAIITRAGLEGGAVYAVNPAIREALGTTGRAVLFIDLRPDICEDALAARLSAPRGKATLASFLRKRGGLAPAQIAIAREATPDGSLPSEPSALARALKHAALAVEATAGIERAISSAGGVCLDAIDDNFMLLARPGVFVAGEMLDWDAPTGGYLLQATFATAVAAANGLNGWIGAR